MINGQRGRAGGYQHIGRIRIAIAAILSRDLGLNCEPDELQPAGGRQRNNTTVYDGYAWEVATETAAGLPFVAGSFDTMTECVRAGHVRLSDGEILADYLRSTAPSLRG